jgi:hypothetical protein
MVPIFMGFLLQSLGGLRSSLFPPGLAGPMITDTERSSVHTQVHNHFNQERHLVTRQVYKQRRAGALAAWRALAA